jgi:hypothetical protein
MVVKSITTPMIRRSSSVRADLGAAASRPRDLSSGGRSDHGEYVLIRLTMAEVAGTRNRHPGRLVSS